MTPIMAAIPLARMTESLIESSLAMEQVPIASCSFSYGHMATVSEEQTFIL